MPTQTIRSTAEHLVSRFRPLAEMAKRYATEVTDRQFEQVKCIHSPENQDDDWLYGIFVAKQKVPFCIVLISYNEQRLCIYSREQNRETGPTNPLSV